MLPTGYPAPGASPNRRDSFNLNLEVEAALPVACGRPLTFQNRLPSMSEKGKSYHYDILRRSIVQAIPYLGPLIDNCIAIPQSNNERENLNAFLGEISKDLELLKENLPQIRPEDSAFAEIVKYISKVNNPKKREIYRNLFYSHELAFKSGKKISLHFWDKHFMQMIERYTEAHFDVMKELHTALCWEDRPMIFRGDEAKQFYESLKMPPLIFLVVILDLEADSLVEVTFDYKMSNEKLRWSNIEYVSETQLWDEFVYRAFTNPFQEQCPFWS